MTDSVTRVDFTTLAAVRNVKVANSQLSIA